MEHLEPFVQHTRIAYFSMEIALRPEIKTYAGGLGVLAGDMARSCADLELPVVFVTLISRQGYIRQEIDSKGRQIDHPDPWEPAAFAHSVSAKIAIELEGRQVWLQPWLYTITSPLGPRIPVLLLDTDVEENAPADRVITDFLYGGDDIYRLKQEAVLGIGGRRLLQALGFEIDTYHLNEGHAAFLAVDLLHRYPRRAAEVRAGESAYEADRVRDHCVFTTHTPVAAAYDKYSYDLIKRVLGDFIEIDQLRMLGGADHLNMTRLALGLSGYVNGVAERHAQTAAAMFHGYRVHAITNGIHVQTWAAPSFARLYQAHFTNWAHEPEVLVRASQLDGDEVWSAHQEAKARLLTYVRETTGIAMSEDVPLLCFARRMTGYKRPDLLFTDIDRLIAIGRKHRFQIVMAGTAHPSDEQGKRLIEIVHEHMRRLDGSIPAAYLPGYDMTIANYMVGGADVWLNTPLPPFEASGTSGMKAALNGVINFSVLDGWWVEAWIEGATGWAIGADGESYDPNEHAAALYAKLEGDILPLYYNDRARWIWMMKESISNIAYYFNSQRVMRRYATEAYLR